MIPCADLEEPESSPGVRIDIKSDKAIEVMRSLVFDYTKKFGRAPKHVQDTLDQMLKEREE